MPNQKKIKQPAVFLNIGPWHEKPWWWDHIKDSVGGCNIEYVRIVPKGDKKEGQLSLIHLPQLSIDIIKALKKLKPGIVFTFECGYASLVISALQTFGFMKSARHVILQFIMREKESTFRSRLKYLVMRIIFSSIDTAICSSKAEALYYQETFKWKQPKTKYVPFHTDPAFLKYPKINSYDDYILAAGRTFRDYNTFFDAVRGTGYRIIVVASPSSINTKDIPENIAFKYDISLAELTELMQKSTFVVVPLEDRKISTGQSIFLQAMALGKTVVVTRTAGSVDYIDHMKNGLLVAPGNFQELREAINYLLENELQRKKIGEKARESVLQLYLPWHYCESLKNVLYKPLSKSLSEAKMSD